MLCVYHCVAYIVYLDIKAVLGAEKDTKELEAALSKKQGEEVFYLEKDREYRSEKDVFEDFTEEERKKAANIFLTKEIELSQ